MATRKSDETDGDDDHTPKLDDATQTPPDLTSDPIEQPERQEFVPDATDDERRALDTFAAEPTPDEFAGRGASASPWGPPPTEMTSDAALSDPHERDSASVRDDEPEKPEPEPVSHAPYGRDATAATPAQSEPASFAAAAPPPPPRKSSSFAGRLLTFLILLIAGAALGIWGAPKLVPHLPAGMAPVAAWLEPGRAETETRLAALESSFAEITSQVAAAPTADAMAAQAQSLVDGARTEIESQIADIRSTLDQSDFTEANERIGRLETTIGGAAAELTSLKDQIAAGAANATDTTSVDIDTYRAELDGLRAEVNELSGTVSGLSAELQEAVAAAEARTQAAEQEAQQVQQEAVAERDLAAAQADVAAIRAALANGGPFADPLAALATNAGITPPAGLEASAATGVQTLAQLRASFSDEAHEAIRASIVAGAGEGILARSRAFIVSNVASRSLSPQEGASPDAVLSRVEDALRRDDLATALSEAEQLPSEAAAALGGWIAAAKARADAEAGLAEVSASVSAMN